MREVYVFTAERTDQALEDGRRKRSSELNTSEEQPTRICRLTDNLSLQRAVNRANGGLSYMSFDLDGDAGTAAAAEAALHQIAEGKGQAVINMLDNAPPARSRPSRASGFVATQSAWNIFGRTTSKPLRAA